MHQDVELSPTELSTSSKLSSTYEDQSECTRMSFLDAVKNCNLEEVKRQISLNIDEYAKDMQRGKKLMSNPLDLEEVEKEIRKARELINFTDHDDNALHIAIKLEVEPLQKIDKLHMIEILINCKRLSQINSENQTPLDLAFDIAETQIISLLLRYHNINLFLDQKSVLEDGKTYRNILKERWPAVYLFYEIYHKKTEQFFKLAENDEQNLLIKDNGCIYTFLQCACENGLTEVVEYYLKNLNVDVNGKTLFMKKSPLKIATIKGYYRIIKLFYEYAEEPQFYEPDLLFTFVDSVMHRSVRKCEAININHFHCLEILFKLNEKNPLFDINMEGDNSKGSILQYSIKHGVDNLVSQLLHHGAWFGNKDVFGDHILKSLKPWILKKHFDDCIKKSSTEYALHTRNVDNNIQFDYRSLAPLKLLKQDGRFIKNQYNVVGLESDLLLEMGHRPQFRELLKHPLITSFLHLKWIVIQKFFYINLIFYFVFCCLLTLYSLMYVSWSNDNLWESKTLNGTTPNIIESPKSDFGDFIGTILHIAAVIFWIVFCLREVLQFFYSPVLYFKSSENWMEIFNAVIGAHLLFQVHVYRELAALLSLTIWGEAVLLLGRHPKLSIYVTMFKTVIVNFLKFFALYGILIFAFALSFCLLFSEKDGKKNEVFENPLMAFFKIFIMMTGEYEASSLPFELFPFISRVVFALFIFLLAIVLLSLLNGLAVGDLAKIRSDAEMSEIICRIETFLYFEKMRLFQSLLNMFNSWSQLERLSGWIRATARTLKLWFTVTLFPDILDTGRASIYMYFNNKIKFRDSEDFRTKNFRMNSNIVEAAESVIEKGETKDGAISSDDLAKSCFNQLRRLDGIENISEHNEKILTQFTPKLEIIERNIKTLMECHECLHVDEQILERNQKLLTEFEAKFESFERTEKKTVMECCERLHVLEQISERNEKMLTTLIKILQQK